MRYDPPEALAAPFRLCPHCGSDQAGYHQVRDFRCPACGFRYFHNVGTACGLLLFRDPDCREILLVERAIDPHRGKFGLPGGFLDPGETVEAALHRELEEEVGLVRSQYTVPKWLGGWPNTYPFGGVRYATCDLYFTAWLHSPDTALTLPDGELSSWRWVDTARLPMEALAFESLRNALSHWRGLES